MRSPIYLLIIGRFSPVRGEIARDMEKLRDEFENLIIIDYDMGKISAIRKDAKLVIVDLENWMPSDEMVLTDLREAGYEGPVIVLTKRLKEAASAGYEAEKIIFFDRTKGQQALASIARRTLLGSLIAVRKYPRHPTNETADIQVDGAAKSYTCKVRNMSKGGALLELETGFSLKVGDNVTVKIKLKQLNRLYCVKACVVWIKLPIFGVEFLGEII